MSDQARGHDEGGATTPVQFPDGFVWGAATASYQIEGAHDADGKGESIWDRFCSEPGRIADGTTGAGGVDHYHRWAEDVALMADLGLDAYRFSIAWPRVIPDGVGAVNQAGLDWYDRLVDALLERGITPMPTLYHWDLPQALEDEGGWPSRITAEAFADYAEVVGARLGDRVHTWLTLNEPFCTAHLGYDFGVHAPGRASKADAFAASHHLLLGHGLATQRLRGVAPQSRVGIVLNFTPAFPGTDSDADRAKAERRNDRDNRWYIEPIASMGYPEAGGYRREWNRNEVRDGDMETIAQPIDLLGVNYYTRQMVFSEPPADDSWQLPTTEMGWEITPQTFGDLLIDLHECYRFPAMLVTENGAAMPDDRRRDDGRVDDRDRIAYIRDHLLQVHRAIEAGAPLEGYLVWSLMDNFEWAYGFAKRFGIVEIDCDTYDRRPKASAEWFSEVARTGVVRPGT